MVGLVLDVGCGYEAGGDVNCDLIVKENRHRDLASIPIKLIENFVLCDAHFLPFKDNCFGKVICSHVFEHVNNPELVMHELVRVSCFEVLVRCPHLYGDKLSRLLSRKHVFHKWFFRCRWFWRFGLLHGLNVKVWISRHLFLVFPSEISARFFKKAVVARHPNMIS